MRSGGLICAILAFGFVASPLAAQQTPPEQPNTPAQQTTPEDTAPLPQQPQFPPATPTNRRVTTGEAPPPFPPMPRHRPPSHRTVDLGGGHHSTSTRHAAKAHRHASHEAAATHVSRKTERFCHGLSHRKMERNAKCKALLSDERKATSHHATHVSPKTVRFCHKLTYREILRHGECEALLRNDFENRSTRGSKDERYCHGLSHRKAERNAKCKALLKDERKSASSGRKHKTRGHEATRNAAPHHRHHSSR